MIERIGRTDLSVVIPAHNSGNVIDATLRRLVDRLKGRSAEIIVVENGSTDDTFLRCTRLQAELESPGIRFIVLRSDKGMGNALRAGALASSGDHVLLTADDLPFGFDDLDAADAASTATGPLPTMMIGSKAHPASVVPRGRLRSTLTWGFAQLRRWTLGMRTGDPQGTILIVGDVLRDLASRVTEPGFLFSTELVLLAERAGIQPVEVPVRLSADHENHKSRISKSDIVAMGSGLFRLRARHADLYRRQRAAGQVAPGRPTALGQADAARVIGGVAISALFLGLTLRQTDAGDLFAGLTNLSVPLVVLTLGVVLLEVSVRAVRWRWLLQPSTSTTIGASFMYICIGHFANALLPFRLGDAARAFLAGKRFRASGVMVLGTIIIERLADGVLLLIVLTIATLFGVAALGVSPGILVAAVAAGAALLTILTLSRRRAMQSLNHRVPRVARQLRNLGSAFEGTRSARGYLQLAATTATSFALAVVILRLALAAAGTELDWWSTAVAISAMTLSTAIPAAPGALGTYEFAGTTALVLSGVSPDAALTAVVVVHVVATVPPALIGLVGTFLLHFDILGLRRLHALPETTPTPLPQTQP